MLRSHNMFTHTSRQFMTSLRTGATSVMPMCATESGKCQTSIKQMHGFATNLVNIRVLTLFIKLWLILFNLNLANSSKIFYKTTD